MSVQQDPIKLSGGLNLVEPALSTPKGEVIAAFNYEADQEGVGGTFTDFERKNSGNRPLAGS